MKKTLFIGLKDLQITFRDRAALIMMLLAPFVLTLALGYVTGSFESDTNAAGIARIRVVVVNEDSGTYGDALVALMRDDETVAELVDVVTAESAAAARASVEGEEATVAVLIPTRFSAALVPDATGQTGEPAPIELYSTPSAPISAATVEAIVESFVASVQRNVAGVAVAVEQLALSGAVAPEQLPLVAAEIAGRLQAEPVAGVVTVRDDRSGASVARFNALALLAPGMALFFLMYTVTLGGRSILLEREDGTLGRMLSTPTEMWSVLGGKVFGVFLIAVAQVSILIFASSVLFSLEWGQTLALALLIVVTALAATGWGVLFAALSQTPTQVAGLGGAVMLLFGLLSGVFIPVNAGILKLASRVTPNAWALDGFVTLGYGETLGAIRMNVLALLVMAAILFTSAVVLFRRRDVV